LLLSFIAEWEDLDLATQTIRNLGHAHQGEEAEHLVMSSNGKHRIFCTGKAEGLHWNCITIRHYYTHKEFFCLPCH
jgi:hypothetical protein